MHTKDRDAQKQEIHHPLRYSSAIPCHIIRGTRLGAKLHSGLANILNVEEMSPLLLKMRKWCPENIICVFLMQKDCSNLYLSINWTSSLQLKNPQPVSL